ncbi:cell division protein FtsZ [uncultured Campylobacter sp.]|uniref:cell division protein FtsZ n=1 Tax=uncultured Campylobacter sp. TaxID=218934 RepID=UPI00262EF019|nr:cell division protein FtsZ [uncultured Campylobacter sp.]
MSEFVVEEAQHARGARIKIIGCGGGGGNMINHMMRTGFDKLDLIVANTDGQALAKSLAKTKIQLGEKTTRGLGAGGNPEVGAESARENYEEIKACLDQSDIVFIASGFGGGTGTGAAPIIAQAAKEVGALTVCVVTMPFNFEGSRKKKLAEEGLAELRKESDSILVVQNEKVKNLIDRNAPASKVYEMVDDVLAKAVKGMVSILMDSSERNVDFADIKSAMEHRGLSLMGVGYAQGPNAADEAMNSALESPLLDGFNVKKAKGVIIHTRRHEDFPFMSLNEALEKLADMIDDDVVGIKHGDSIDNSMATDEIEFTVVATGFEYANAQAPKKDEQVVENRQSFFVQTLGKTGTLNREEIMYHIENEPAWKRNQMD